MLKIKPIERYTIPRYPKSVYTEAPDFISLATPRGALTAAVMALLLEACNGGGTGPTGVPFVDPTAVTESEARTIIDQVFTTNGISLTHDVNLSIETAPGDTTIVNVDGFNDSLQVGYEYLHDPDYTTFTPKVRAALDSLANESGPYVKSIDSTLWEQIDFLQAVTQEFIDSLKANGSI